MRYKDYLKTEHWIKTKEIHYSNPDNGFCSSCGSTENLHVHHKRYNSGVSLLFREKPNVLSTLCRDCHKKRHETLDYQRKIENEKTLKRKLGTIAYYSLKRK